MRLRLWLLVLGVCAGSLACSSMRQSQGAGSQGGVTAPSQPKAGGVLRLRFDTDPFNFDISQSRTGPNGESVALAYDTLLSFRYGPDVPWEETTIEPGLAERWEVSPDAKTYTFYLRKGVKFAPFPKIDGVNGRELTSADVKWSYEYGSRTAEFQGMTPRSEYNFMFEGLDRVEAPDRYTVVVRFKEPFAPFLNYAGASWNAIMPREIYEQDGHLKDRMLGTGPFQLDSEASQKGTRWVFKKNPDYWVEGRPYVDEVRYFTLPDDTSMLAAFQTRQIDVLHNAEAIPVADRIKSGSPDAVLYEVETAHPWAFQINETVPPFDDVRVRKALSLALDRDEFLNTFQRGRGSHLLPAVYRGYFTQEEVKQMQPYDPEQAKRLLMEAGYPNGVDVEWTYPGTAYGEQYVSILQLIQAQAKKAGFNVNLKTIDREAFSGNLRTRSYIIGLQSGGSRRWDVDLSFADFFSTTTVNYHGINDPKMDDLIGETRRIGDVNKRREAIKEATRYIMERQYSIGLFSQIQYYAWHPHVKDYGPNWNLVGPAVRDVWLDIP